MSLRTLYRILDIAIIFLSLQALAIFGIAPLLIGFSWGVWSYLDGRRRQRWLTTADRNIWIAWRDTPFMRDRYGLELRLQVGVSGVLYQSLAGFNFRNPDKLLETDLDRYIVYAEKRHRKENEKNANPRNVSNTDR